MESLHQIAAPDAVFDTCSVAESFSKTERDLARLDKDVNYLYEDLYKERPPSRVRPEAGFVPVCFVRCLC